MSGSAIFIAGRFAVLLRITLRMLSLTDEHGAVVEFTPDTFVIAGYTGRDRQVVQQHIDELAHQGIAPPHHVPMLYPMPVDILTTDAQIAVPTKETAGEVEPVLIGIGRTLYLGVGSDHTARDVEREDIAKSKRICPKPLGRTIARVGALDSSLDGIALESWIDGEAYQRGTLAAIMPLAALLELFRKTFTATNFVLSCGTVPLLTGAFRFGRTFKAQLRGGPLHAPLTLEYAIQGD